VKLLQALEQLVATKRFSEFVRQTGPLWNGIAKSLVRSGYAAASADDLVQEMLTAVWKGMLKGESPEFLMVQARRAAKTHWARAKGLKRPHNHGDGWQGTTYLMIDDWTSAEGNGESGFDALESCRSRLTPEVHASARQDLGLLLASARTARDRAFVEATLFGGGTLAAAEGLCSDPELRQEYGFTRSDLVAVRRAVRRAVTRSIESLESTYGCSTQTG
jgi:DNA-directed RNA polymerase specialized sigma24 family protein